MAKTIQLKAADGHQLDAYVAEPAGKPRGLIVAVQEIFGVNSHIRSVADGYAADGYLAIAPAMFDRVQKTVIRGPFRVSPKPPWFVTNKMTHRLGPHLVALEARPSIGKLFGVAVRALRG